MDMKLESALEHSKGGRAFGSKHHTEYSEWPDETLRAHIDALEHKHDDLVTRCVQAESDRDALEAKLAEQIREDEMRLINHCIKIIDNNSRSHLHAEAEFLTKIAELEEQINLMSKHQAGVDEKLCELEAENKRLREALQWDTTTLPDTDRTVMVERESGGFWWGQHVLGEWHLKYGDGWISADDVIAWRDLPISAKDYLTQTAEPAKVCVRCKGSGVFDYARGRDVCLGCNGTGRAKE